MSFSPSFQSLRVLLMCQVPSPNTHWSLCIALKRSPPSPLLKIGAFCQTMAMHDVMVRVFAYPAPSARCVWNPLKALFPYRAAVSLNMLDKIATLSTQKCLCVVKLNKTNRFAAKQCFIPC